MKRTFKTILCAAAAVLAAVSCQKSVELVQTAEEGKGTIEVRVNGLMGEYNQVDATKAELVNTIRVSWKGGETVYVYDGNKCIGSLVASLEGDEDRYAVLSTDGDEHQIETPAQDTKKLTLVYSPLLTEKQELSDHELYISLEAQSGEKAPFVAYATLEYKGETTITGTVVPFKFATSVIKVNCTGLKASTAITSATLNNVNTNCLFKIFEDAVFVSGAANGAITRTGSGTCSADQVNGEGEAVFQIAVPKLSEEVPGARVLTVAQGSDNFEDKNFTTKSLSAATSVNTVCQLVEALPAGALPGVFTVSNDDGMTKTQIYFSQGNLYYDGSKFNFEANQYDYTPSADGSSWSTDHISHFYWSMDARVAYWDSYSSANTTCGITPGASDVCFTNETETTAKAGFTVNVGGKEQGGWRTLSTKEWQYLFNTRTVNGGTGEDKSYSQNITYGGKVGLVLYPDNYDKDPISGEVTTELPEGVVFLPGAGCRNNSVVYFYSGSLYWSSSAMDESNAHYVKIGNFSVTPDYYYDRSIGASVRLITEAK